MVLPKRVLAPVALAAVMLLTGGVISATSSTAEADTAPSSGSSDIQSAPDEATAMALATQENHAVRVDGETTAQTSVSAQPDGSFQFEAEALPVRTQRDGAWVDIDESLAADSSGMLAPRVPYVPVRFSNGGSNILDEVQTTAGDWVSETWPFGNLPTPVVSGATVIYPEALPGVDVQLTATVSGMTSVLVVKNPAAAADPRLQSFHLSPHGAAMSAAASDTMLATASDGSTARAGSPLWWDSKSGGNAKGPGGNESDRPVAHTTDSTGMTLDVGQTVAAANPTYPVYVDPDWTWSSGITSSWYTDKAYPDQSYLTSAQSDVLRVGIYDIWNSHMFFQFPLSSKLAGSKIIDASLDMTQLSLDACPTNSITLEMYGPQTAGFTWNGESGTWHGSLGSKTPGTCSNPGSDVAVGWDVKSAIASMTGKSSIQFGLKSTTSAQSRRHFSRSAKLTVTYDHAPDNPTSPTFVNPVRSCSTSSSSPVVFNGKQTMKVQVNQKDSDGGTVGTDFYLQDITTSTQVFKYVSGLQAQDQGTNKDTAIVTWSYDTSSLTEGHEYAWRAQGSDHVLTSSGYTSWCYFTIDNTVPTSPTFPSHTDATAVGEPVDVTIAPGTATDVAGYEYWVTQAAATTPAPAVPVTVSKSKALPSCGSTSGATTLLCATTTSITVAPVDDASVLWLAAYDKAGNTSPAIGLALTKADGASVGIAGTASDHFWKFSAMSSPLPSPIPDSIAAHSTTATDTTMAKDLAPGSAIGLGSADTVNDAPDIPVLQFDGAVAATTSVAASGPAVDTLQSFSASAYVKQTSATGTQTILAQSGASRAGFVLESVEGTMTFCLQPQTGSTTDCVSASAATPAGTWVLVTGIWDSVNHQIRLVLGDDTSQPQVAPHAVPTGDTTANGAVTLGSAQVGGVLANSWNGSITNPRVAQMVLDSTVLSRMKGLF